MRLALITKNPRLYTSRRLLNAIRGAGHQGMVINPFRCTLTTHPFGIRLGKRRLTLPDGAIPRLGALGHWPILSLLRHLEMAGVSLMNRTEAIAIARDKWHTMQCLQQAGIPIPPSMTNVAADIVHSLQTDTGWVIKTVDGLQGSGVVLGPTMPSAMSIATLLQHAHLNALIQPFYPEASGQDVRCLVVKNQVIASMKRQHGGGDFRSNLHQGGKAIPYLPTPHETELAVESTRTIGLSVAGVDMIQTHHGPLVLEVNASPGLEGLESVTEIDVAAHIIGAWIGSMT